MPDDDDLLDDIQSHDWEALRGLRNVLAHQYGDIDLALLHAIVKTRLPGLVAAIDEAG